MKNVKSFVKDYCKLTGKTFVTTLAIMPGMLLAFGVVGGVSKCINKGLQKKNNDSKKNHKLFKRH